MYKLLRNILFLTPPETAHFISMTAIKFGCAIPFVRQQMERRFNANTKPYSIFNLHFANRVGLGAGFDKNAKYLRELQALGFGFVEIGTVTPKPQSGNESPRVFRLISDKALINRMGFNNEGVKVVAERLKKWRNENSRFDAGNSKSKSGSSNKSAAVKRHSLIIGGNIGKNKVTPNEDAWRDYEICFRELHSYVDFFVVNVSSPNTPGLRELQEKGALKKILTHLQNLNTSFADQKPILLKIAPDLTTEQ